MKFYGLFIGIDRYASPTINWLNCAARDARALYGIFTDNLGNNTKLLTDKDASRAAIELEFNKLAECNNDDVVGINQQELNRKLLQTIRLLVKV